MKDTILLVKDIIFMAFTSLETEQSLDLLLNILPDIKHIGSFLNAKVDKATFRNVISKFEIAAYQLCENLKDLGRTTAVTDGAQVIYRAVVCLEKIASPSVSTQEVPDIPDWRGSSQSMLMFGSRHQISTQTLRKWVIFRTAKEQNSFSIT